MNRHLSKLFLLTTTALIGFSTASVSAQPYEKTAAKQHKQRLVNAESKSSPDNLQGTLGFKRQSLLLPLQSRPFGLKSVSSSAWVRSLLGRMRPAMWRNYPSEKGLIMKMH